MPSVRIGLFPPIGQLELDPDRLQAFLAGAVREGDRRTFRTRPRTSGRRAGVAVLAAAARAPMLWMRAEG